MATILSVDCATGQVVEVEHDDTPAAADMQLEAQADPAVTIAQALVQAVLTANDPSGALAGVKSNLQAALADVAPPDAADTGA